MDIEVLIYVTKIRIEIWYTAGYPVPSQFKEHFCILYYSGSNIVCGGAAEDQNDVDPGRISLQADIVVLISVTKIRIEIRYTAGYPVPSQF